MVMLGASRSAQRTLSELRTNNAFIRKTEKVRKTPPDRSLSEVNSSLDPVMLVTSKEFP